jgi:hypothetical protein
MRSHTGEGRAREQSGPDALPFEDLADLRIRDATP